MQHVLTVEHTSHVASSLLELVHAEGAQTVVVQMNVLFRKSVLLLVLVAIVLHLFPTQFTH